MYSIYSYNNHHILAYYCIKGNNNKVNNTAYVDEVEN